MVRFILIIFSITIFSISTFGQTKNPLIGKWIVYDVVFDKRDSITDIVNMSFGKFLFNGASYYFGENKIYKFIITDLNEEGNWEFDRSTQRIKFISVKGTVVNKGTITYADVKLLKNDTLFLRRDSIQLMLKRIN